MKKFFLILLLILIIPSKIYAIENPLGTSNNKFGVHILFTNELQDAAKLVNTSGGDWGYVTIPIQVGDRDIVKWQTFMDQANDYHIIPLIRLASEGDYFNTNVWKKPTYEDITDFANFLDSLIWPTKNKYIIVFNEPNRADEWNGEVNPSEYAELLSYTVKVFKDRSSDYFIISAGMDNAAPNLPPDYMNEYVYFQAMEDAVPGIFNRIDGFASHSYPNPGFSQPPEIQTSRSITSFKYERDLIQSYRDNDIPVFITETGWNTPNASDTEKAVYYRKAFDSVWSDNGIVAVTPFLLHAGDGPFKGFSFINQDGSQSEQFKLIKDIPKIAAQPVQNPVTLSMDKLPDLNLPKRDFSKQYGDRSTYTISDIARNAFRWIMKL